MVNKQKNVSTEEKILIAAKKVFFAKGLDGARMQDIADEAGINKALLHYYYRSKEKLFEMIFHETAGQLFPKFEKILSSDDNVFDKIRKIVDNYISLIIQNPYLPLFVLNEMNRNNNADMKHFFEKMRPAFAQKIIELLEKEMAAKRIKKMNAPQLFINMMAMCAFPFIAKPIISMVLKTDEQAFKKLMEQRKKEVAEFIINSIKK